MHRRQFIQHSFLAGALGTGIFSQCFQSCSPEETKDSEFLNVASTLLKDWCDGMLRNQIIAPEDITRHGALGCPSCGFIHGRCMDAVYPFLYMADKTGDKKYLNAAILVMQWAENNVSHEDGSWTVISNPRSWKGISVFGAIAMAEAVHYHGHVLPEAVKTEWLKRLERVGEYIYNAFTMTFTNVNYGFTAVYGLNLLGRVTNNQAFVERSHAFAKEVKNFFTKPNTLLFGEGKPSNKLSDKGLPFVDLGYNVEESLAGVVSYALHENDEEMLDLLTASMNAHLEFMVPDGAWDNSWGTRQAKWSYWGSRTTDGCQLTFAMMADRNPAFGTAAFRNLTLLRNCTNNGLLHGGPHYHSHNIEPCIHHTFAHAKPLAGLLNMQQELPRVENTHKLPRETSYGIKAFPEISTWLVSTDQWKGTVTSYDAVYKEHIQQVTGGAIGLLYHQKVGTILAGSMAKYKLVEKNNMQVNKEQDFPLTPRIETFADGIWFTNLYDLKAKVVASNTKTSFQIESSLLDEDRNPLGKTANPHVAMEYLFHDNTVIWKAELLDSVTQKHKTAMVLPVISKNNEKVVQESKTKILVKKPTATVVIEANVPISIHPTKTGRVFNMVPGMEAVPLKVFFESKSIECKVSIV